MDYEKHVTAALLYNLVACDRRGWLDVHGDPDKRDPVSAFVALLWRRGVAHEREVLSGLVGGEVLDLRCDTPDVAAERTRGAMSEGVPVILGGRIVSGRKLGVPDLLVRCARGYRPGDVKSGAGEDGEGVRKRAYGVQLAHYAAILEELGLLASEHPFVLDASGTVVDYPLEEPLGRSGPPLRQIYGEVLSQAEGVLDGSLITRPALAACCKLCHWRSACRQELDGAGDVTLVPQLGRALRSVLEPSITCISDLADLALGAGAEASGTTPFKGVGPKRLRRLVARARLLCQPGSEPYALAPLSLARRTREIFFDIEADPGRADFVYLHGALVREAADAGDAETFFGFFVDDLTEAAEREAFARAFAFLAADPAARVYYWSKYERTAYRRLQARYPAICSPGDIEALFDSSRSTDLYFDVVLPLTEWPSNDYSIKSLAKLCGFSWRDVDPSGASSIEWFDRWASSLDEAMRNRILLYNEDDCVATRVVFDRLLTLPVRAE